MTLGRTQYQGSKSVPFITDITPTSGGTISDKVYAADTDPADQVLISCRGDIDDITVAYEYEAGPNSWQQVVTINGVEDSIASQSQVGNSRRFSGSVNISLSVSDIVVMTMPDGASTIAVFIRGLDAPSIMTALIDTHPTTTGGNARCPLAQTQVNSDDQIQISGTAEAHATYVYVKDFEVTNGEGLQGPFTIAQFIAGVLINCGTGDNATAKYRVYATVGVGGTPGADTTSSDEVDLNQTVPTFGAFSVSYPGVQEAFKGAETVGVTLTHTNIETGDGYVYVDPTGTDIVIPSLTTYTSPKTGVTIDTAGIYRDDSSPNNFRLTVTRLQKNGKSASSSGTIEIADIAAVVTIGRDSSGSVLPRMGTDDGTNSYKDDEVFVVSNQRHLSTSTSSVINEGGDTAAFIGSWVQHDVTSFKRTKRVEDGDINAGGQAANNYTWGVCSVTNRAETETTSVTTNPTYSLGGFDVRTINIGPITGGDPPYTHTGDIGVPIVDTSKVVVVNTSKGGSPGQTYEGSVIEHNDVNPTLNNYWTTVAALASEAFDDYTQYFHCSDKKFYESVTASEFDCTIAESV